MRLLSIRTLRMAAVAVALVACDAGRIVAPLGPTPSAPEAPRTDVVVAAPPLVITEIMVNAANLLNATGGTTSTEQEWIEVYNPGSAGVDISGYKITSMTGSGNLETSSITAMTAGSLTVPASGCVVLATNIQAGAVSFQSSTVPVAGKFAVALSNSAHDYIALHDGTGASVDSVDWSGAAGTNHDGLSAYLGAGPDVDPTTIDNSRLIAGGWVESTSASTSYDGGRNHGTPGTCHYGTSSGVVVPAEVASVTMSPTTATVNAGATLQLSATALDASSKPIANTTFAWTSSDATIASVTSAGLATGLKGGSATITATTTNGKSASATLTVVVGVAGPDIRVSELHYDNTGADQGEAMEIEGPAGTTLAGWSIVLYNGSAAAATDTTPAHPAGVMYNTTPVSGTLVEGPNHAACNGRGVLVVNYPVNGIQNGGNSTTGAAADGFALIDDTGKVIEFLSYEGSFTAFDGPAAGMTSHDIGVSEPGTDKVGLSLHRSPDGSTWSAPAANDFGYVNACGGPPAPPPPALSFSGRDPLSDPPLPVGFEAQVFASEVGVSGTKITWSSETPAIASVDSNGVFHGLSVGTAILRATATDGTTATISYPVAEGVKGNVTYAGNVEFGEPADADASDDYIVRHDEYTLSYSSTRNTPNWVSYRIDASNFGSNVDRCNCFTMDPLLPASFAHLTTADYTGAGAAAGYGIDRGHMARSADRTAGTLDNAHTYYLSNVIPQAADLNQGPWAQMENYLGDQAKAGKEVYVIDGPAGSKGTVKNQGKIVIPAQVWKVAVLMDHGKGLADVHAAGDLQVIAIVAPNDAGVKGVDWHTWQVTVDSVQKLSGYDFLAALPDRIECTVEARNCAPVAAISGSGLAGGNEGQTLSFSAATSTDSDVGDQLSYAWAVNGQDAGTQPTLSYTFANNGSFTLRLIATDNHGAADTTSATVSIANVAPVVSSFAGATLIRGEPYASAGSFTDPGADTWTATVDYGDGSGAQPLALPGKSFTLSNTYAAAGTYTVTVAVSDGDAVTTRTATVTVATPAQAIGTLSGTVSSLASAGTLTRGEANALDASLRNALKALSSDTPAAGNELGAFINKVEAMQQSGRITAETAASLIGYAQRIIASIG